MTVTEAARGELMRAGLPLAASAQIVVTTPLRLVPWCQVRSLRSPQLLLQVRCVHPDYHGALSGCSW